MVFISDPMWHNMSYLEPVIRTHTVYQTHTETQYSSVIGALFFALVVPAALFFFRSWIFAFGIYVWSVLYAVVSWRPSPTNTGRVQIKIQERIVYRDRPAPSGSSSSLPAGNKQPAGDSFREEESSAAAD